MEYTNLLVRENSGDKKMAVKIISQEKINATTKQIMSEMTFDEAEKFGRVMGWEVVAAEK
ncbi:MAG: hypothetical protein IIV40_02205 [Oscillospiraceae bacterium]|nr:hypothetical protein [Oscillospiraceae bacterium]